MTLRPTILLKLKTTTYCTMRIHILRPNKIKILKYQSLSGLHTISSHTGTLDFTSFPLFKPFSVCFSDSEGTRENTNERGSTTSRFCTFCFHTSSPPSLSPLCIYKLHIPCTSTLYSYDLWHFTIYLIARFSNSNTLPIVP